MPLISSFSVKWLLAVFFTKRSGQAVEYILSDTLVGRGDITELKNG